MSVRWSIVLPVMHLLLATLWVALNESRDWGQLPTLERIDEFTRTHPELSTQSGNGEVGWDAISVDYRPLPEEKALLSVDLAPSLITRAGYGHGFALFTSRPYFFRALERVGIHFRLKTRILTTNFLLLVLVALQWMLLGRSLDRTSSKFRFRTLLRSPELQISALAILMAIGSLLYYYATESSIRSAAVSEVSELLVALGALLVLLLWIIWGVRAIVRLALAVRRRVLAGDTQRS